MPRVNQVKTLKDLCMVYVAKEMVRKWTEFFEFDQSYIKLLQQGEDEELYEKYVKPNLDLLRKISHIKIICQHTFSNIYIFYFSLYTVVGHNKP